jgi:peptide/nickel transport system permease protein
VRTLVRRIADALVLFWLVVTVTFGLVRLAPGDPAALLVPPGASASEIASLRREFGLDAPLPLQYARWMGRVLSGDLGESFSRRQPVRQVLAEALPISIGLGVASLALTFLIGVSVGVFQASRRSSRVDTSITILTTTIYAAPSFWLALALIAVFTYGAATLGLPHALRLPAIGIHDPAGLAAGWAAVADLLRHSVLPVSVLAMIGAAGIARYTRSAVADVLRLDFVRTAVAKGLSARAVHVRHVLANTLPQLVVLLALSLPGLVAGSVFVETIFSWPGMGRVMWTSINARDYPVVLAITIVYAAIVIGANLAADLALPWLDPRRRDA